MKCKAGEIGLVKEDGSLPGVLADDLPDEEAAVEDQDRLDDECQSSRVRCECFFPTGVPPLDFGWICAALPSPHPEEADLQEKGVAQKAKDETPGIVEHARIQRNDSQRICGFAGSTWGAVV